MDTDELLDRIGITGNQATVYLTLLRLGRAAAVEIARQTGIKRPTVYDNLRELQDQGLVSITAHGTRRVYIAEDPKRLQQLARRYQHTVRSLIPQLQQIFAGSAGLPHVQMFEGAEGVRQVFEELLSTTTGSYCYFGSAKDMIDALGEDYLDEYVHRRVTANIRSRAIRIRNKEVNFSPLSNSKKFLREVRYIRQEVSQDLAALFIFDGKIGIISTTKERYGLIIASRELAGLLQVIWDFTWKQTAEAIS